jgi:hypothetical protein
VTYKIVGNIVDDSANPIVGADVFAVITPLVEYVDMFTPNITGLSAVSDDTGNFEIILPAPSGVVEYHVFACYKSGATLYTGKSIPYVQISG